MDPVLYETHMHTPLCKHAVGSPEEYAATAESRGLKGIIVTCHNPIPDGYNAAVRMDISEFETYVAMVDRAATTWRGRIDVRLGMESDFYPGAEPWVEKLHTMAHFHHILGSVHPQMPEYRSRYFTGDWVAYQKLYYTHLAEAAETGLFDTLSHPDLVKNESPAEWSVDRIADHVRSCLDRIAKTGVAMELNTSGLNKRLPEMNPNDWQLREMAARGIPVVIGADAHRPERVADRFPEALEKIRRAGYEHTSIFLDRKRHDIPVDDALASLRENVDIP